MAASLEQVRKRFVAAGGALTPLARFADLLFDKADPDLFRQFDTDSLYAMAVDGLRFLEGTVGDAPEVQVFNPSFEIEGWEAPFTVVRMRLHDRPFIVDSVRAELRRRDVELFHLLHPIVSPLRDDAGKVIGFDANAEREAREAFEMYFVSRIDDGAARDALQGAVTSMLEDVLLATGDYDAMREQSRAMHAYLLGLKGKRITVAGAEDEELEEYAAFMDWLDDDNYVYLGYRGYDVGIADEVRSLWVTPGSGLGILSDPDESAYGQPVAVAELSEGLRERVLNGGLFRVTKTNRESTVHRPARMDYVGIKKLSEEGTSAGEHRFLGLFTSKAHATPVIQIPILRRKLRQVLDLDDALPGSHDYKGIVSVFNSMPREELFWADAEYLHSDIRAVLGLEQERGVRLTLRPDPLSRGIGVMVIMPRESFNADVRRAVQKLLSKRLAAKHVDYNLAIGEDQVQVRFHFFFTTDTDASTIDVKKLEDEVAEIARSWQDELRERLVAEHGEVEGRRLSDRYALAFDTRYTADTPVIQALRDIQNLESLDGGTAAVDLLNPAGDDGADAATLVRIYHVGHGMVLSDVLPRLENLGFRVLEQIPYMLTFPDDKRGIDVFRVQDKAGAPIDLRVSRTRLIEALEASLQGVAENDHLNRLVLYGGLDVREVALLRAYQMHYAQLNAVTSRRYVNDTLLAHPDIASALVRYFETRFDPRANEARADNMASAREAIIDQLAGVRSLAEDSILRGLLDLMQATVRTNYFLGKPYLSFKVASGNVASMPEPRPLYEIAVASIGVEGVHLRGGKVARGGIRWSDRPDDFRTEVLGLMKTQTMKNAVIVPVGSKGGFVLKGAPAGRDAVRSYAREQYKVYIRGLLDLTDNLVEGAVVRPEGLVLYDDDDPYLVVAADKGTASFSDLANETAAEYDYWLGDAFASGGSYGYDHKGMGITARGAWECVKRHFAELGVDVFRDAFTAAGIGDMSGDVFGNGMKYTDRTRLLAAFNHMHIFLDPDPDAAASFTERQRLFDLPRSGWNDYDAALISQGGGVFDRSAKSIPLSPEVRAMLSVEVEAMSGRDLVKAVLRMRVDLLWNGGIGTYVRASDERDADVGDSANDAVRVAASELRCRIVGEGGNLGFTQLARIEYARLGGRINTDAIDNSAGVDTSDHEVNIKILLQPLVATGELSFEQRNVLLKEMTDDVAALVLEDNDAQSLALSLARRRSVVDIELFGTLLEELVETGGLDPAVEFLPDARQLAERARTGEGLTRPELAVIMAYVKMELYRRLLESLGDEPYFDGYLVSYFPAVLGERYPEALDHHPLRREIIATAFTNVIVNLLGPTFVHRAMRDSGAGSVEVVRAALMALEILEARDLARTLDERLRAGLAADAYYEALDELVASVDGIVSWMLFGNLARAEVVDFVEGYRRPLRTLRSGLEGFLPAPERNRFKARVRQLEKLGFDEKLAAGVASLAYLPSSVGIIDVSNLTRLSLEDAAKRFFELGERLSLGWLRDAVAVLPADSTWEKIAMVGLVMDMREVQRRLTVEFAAAEERLPELDVTDFLAGLPHLLARYDDVMSTMREPDELSLAGAAVLVRLLTQAHPEPA